MRTRLAEQLLRMGFRAFAMEAKPNLEGETHTAKFHRLLEEENVATFALVWPRGTRLNGLSVEVGFLLARLLEGDVEPDQVVLLAEKGNVPIQDDPEAVFEPGNRTRYYEDLLDFGCPVLRWRTESELFVGALNVALEHHVCRVDGATVADLVEQVREPRPGSRLRAFG